MVIYMSYKGKYPLKFGVIFGVGIFLYLFSSMIFPLYSRFHPVTHGPALLLLFFTFLSLLVSYILLVFGSFVSITIPEKGSLEKKLMVGGFILLVLSPLFLFLQFVSDLGFSMGPFFILSYILLYSGVSFSLLGYHFYSSTYGFSSKNIGFIIPSFIIFMSAVQYVISFYFAYLLYWFLFLAIPAPILCILSGYHSSRMLKEDNHDKM